VLVSPENPEQSPVLKQVVHGGGQIFTLLVATSSENFDRVDRVTRKTIESIDHVFYRTQYGHENRLHIKMREKQIRIHAFLKLPCKII
jgi:hypothetical protein